MKLTRSNYKTFIKNQLQPLPSKESCQHTRLKFGIRAIRKLYSFDLLTLQKHALQEFSSQNVTPPYIILQ